MTLWLKQDTIEGFFLDEPYEDVTVDKIEASDDELGFRINGISGIDLTGGPVEDINSFVRDIDGRWFIALDEGGNACIYVYGPKSASGGFHAPLEETL
jgi:hypothetical protein